MFLLAEPPGRVEHCGYGQDCVHAEADVKGGKPKIEICNIRTCFHAVKNNHIYVIECFFHKALNTIFLMAVFVTFLFEMPIPT